MKFCDGGSSYCKIYDSETNDYSIVPTKKLASGDGYRFNYGTGYLIKKKSDKFINQLLALAEGGLRIIDDKDFTILDIGGRDTKYVTFKNRELIHLNWNISCGGNMGFTVEILGNYYDIDFSKLQPADDSIPVTCGLLGIERVFDEINKGSHPSEGIAKFIHGMVRNARHFAGKPEKIYLSGGFCMNTCFVKTLEKYCKVELLGRFVPLMGLISIAEEECEITIPNNNDFIFKSAVK